MVNGTRKNFRRVTGDMVLLPNGRVILMGGMQVRHAGTCLRGLLGWLRAWL